MGRHSLLTIMQLAMLRNFVMRKRKTAAGVTAELAQRVLGLGHVCLRTVQRAIRKVAGLSETKQNKQNKTNKIKQTKQNKTNKQNKTQR